MATPARKTAPSNTTSLRAVKNGTGAKNLVKIVSGPTKKIPVDLVGVRYQVKPPKAALSMRLALMMRGMDLDEGEDTEQDLETISVLMGAMDKWINQAFGSKAESIQDRLEDPEDDLDFPHIMQLMEALATQASANPTT